MRNKITAIIMVLAMLGVLIPTSITPAQAQPTRELSNRGLTWNEYRNPDGTYTQEIYGSPINYLQDGVYVPIDTNIVPYGQLGYDYAVETGVYHAYFKESPISAYQVMVEKDGNYVAYDVQEPVFTNTTGGKIKWDKISDTNVGTPTANVFTYPIYSGVDLEYQYQTAFLKENIIISDKTAIPLPYGWTPEETTLTFKFRLYHDLTIYVDGVVWTGGAPIETNGIVEFKDANGNVVFYLPRPYAIDSHPDAKINETHRRALTYRLIQTPIGTFIDINVPYTWLDSPDRVYPVVVDPTTLISPPGKDTFVDKYEPDTNKGGSEFLETQTYPTEIKRILIEFNISSITSSHTISNASLCMFATGTYTGAAHSLDIYRITSSWTETGVTWNTQPSYASTYESRTSITSDDSYDWFIFNSITDLVVGWHNGTYTNYGMMINQSVEGEDINRYYDFYSKEHGTTYAPYLNITLTNNVPTLTSISASPTIVKNGDNITITTSGAYDGDDDSYRLICGASSGASDLCTGSLVANGTEATCTFTSTWTDDIAHTVYCRLSDTYDDSIEKTVDVTADNTDPTKVTLTTPADGVITRDLTPTLDWSDATEPNFKNYTIQVSDSSAFSWINYTYELTGSVTNSSMTPATDWTTDHVYHIRPSESEQHICISKHHY